LGEVGADVSRRSASSFAGYGTLTRRPHSTARLPPATGHESREGDAVAKEPFEAGRQDPENRREARHARRSVAMSHPAEALPEAVLSELKVARKNAQMQ
jgi:hypothetical protein